MKSNLTLRLLGASVAVAASVLLVPGANAAGARPIGEYCLDGICLGEPATAYADQMWPEDAKQWVTKYPVCGGGRERTTAEVSSNRSKFKTKSGYPGTLKFRPIPGSDKGHYIQLTDIDIRLPTNTTMEQMRESFESVAQRLELNVIPKGKFIIGVTSAQGIAKNGWKVILAPGPGSISLDANTGVTGDSLLSQPGCGAATPKL